MEETVGQADRFGLGGLTLDHRYRIERQIAEGGFAVIYRALQVALERPVALKVLKMPPGLDFATRAGFRDRFADEARTIARLNHPHVVGVYDFGIVELPAGEVAPWMALEWLDGETLEASLARRRSVGGRPPAAVVALLRPIIEALAHAHRRGIVHRDIKPANVMLVTTDDGPRLRMLDFGIAKRLPSNRAADATEPGIGNSGVPAFSPDYAAPEQVAFSRTGPFTDVHALGLLLTELLTDEPPFAIASEDHIFEQVMSSARPTPRAKGKDVGKLEAVISKAVALSPARRWRNAGELLAALDEAMPLRPPPRGADARTTVRIHRRLSGLTAPAPPGASARLDGPAMLGGGLAALLGGALALVAATLTGKASEETPRPSMELSAARRATAPRRPAVASAPAPSGAPAPWIVPIAPANDVPAPPVPAVASKAAAATPSVVVSVPPPRAARSVPRVCRMTINSIPWSEVWIDGQNTGLHTPFVDYPVPCGRHRLEFKRPDLAIDETESIVVKPGEAFKQRFALVRLD